MDEFIPIPRVVREVMTKEEYCKLHSLVLQYYKSLDDRAKADSMARETRFEIERIIKAKTKNDGNHYSLEHNGFR